MNGRRLITGPILVALCIAAQRMTGRELLWALGALVLGSMVVGFVGGLLGATEEGQS